LRAKLFIGIEVPGGIIDIYSLGGNFAGQIFINVFSFG